MKTKLYILPLAIAGIMSACVEDEGSYTYTEVNEIKIEGIEDAYDALAFLDTVRITPTVTGSLTGEDISDYEFTWYRCSNNHTHDTISHEKDLVWKADVQPGTHNIYLSVKDNTTGYDLNYRTSIKASSPYTRGFLILGNRPNDDLIGLDMLTMVAGRDTTYVQDVFDNSEHQLRKAKSLVYTGYYLARTRFYLITEEGAYNLTFSESFDLIAEFNQLGIIEPLVPHKIPMKMMDVAIKQGVLRSYTYTYPRVYLTEDYAFACRPSASEYMTEPFNKYNVLSSEYFKFYPYVFYNTRKNYLNSPTAGSSYSPIMLYDMDNDCFSYVSVYALNAMQAMQNSPSHGGVWMNNKPYGRTIVYGENDYTSGNGYCNAIMKDAQDNYYLYRFVVSMPTYSFGAVIPQITNGNSYNLDLSILTDFDKREQIFFSSYYTLMYYSVGNTLYAYDYVNKTIASKVFDGKISYLAPEVSSNIANNSWYWVATYDGTKGHIYKMVTSNDPNKIDFIDLPNQNWEVNLEVKSILWKGQSSY